MHRASLRVKLLRLLVPPVLVALVLGSAVAYKASITVATEAHDLALTDLALALSQRIRLHDGELVLDLPRVAEQVLKIDRYDAEYFAVRDDTGRLLGGEAELLPPREARQPGDVFFYDTKFGGNPVRAAAVAVPCEGRLCSVLVAETTIKRDRLSREVLFASVMPQLLLTVFAAAALWVGVKSGLRPLATLSDEIKARSPADLRPIDEAAIPQEVQPIVHELNQLFDRVGEANENQRRFLANAAHQLRTPLAGLQTHTELARQYPVPDGCRTELDYVHAGVIRAAHLANQLLTLARAEPGAGRAGITADLDLSEVVTGCADEWVHRALNRGLDLGFELAPARLKGDRFLIGELSVNLIANAVEYTPEGGQITVRTGTDADGVFIEVEDDGPGIPPEERSKVLQRFYRVSGAVGQGSGLGLAIVNETAIAHGGKVDIADGHPANAARGFPGCRIRVNFPGNRDSVGA